MRKERPAVIIACFALFLTACTIKAVGDPEKPITIKAHIVVDIREMKSTATGIEDMVEAGAVPPKNLNQSAPMKLSLLSVAKRFLEPEVAYAEGGYDLKEMTYSVKAALAGRSARYTKLATLKSLGKVGEDNEGHVKNIDGDAATGEVVKAENQDREVIYQAIVSQNDLPANAIYTVRTVFAEVQNKKSKPGEKVQLPAGEWVTKS